MLAKPASMVDEVCHKCRQPLGDLVRDLLMHDAGYVTGITWTGNGDGSPKRRRRNERA